MNQLYQVFLERDPQYLFVSKNLSLSSKNREWDPIDLNPELWIAYKHNERDFFVYAIHMKQDFLAQQGINEIIGGAGDYLVIDVFKTLHVVPLVYFIDHFTQYAAHGSKYYVGKPLKYTRY